MPGTSSRPGSPRARRRPRRASSPGRGRRSARRPSRCTAARARPARRRAPPRRRPRRDDAGRYPLPRAAQSLSYRCLPPETGRRPTSLGLTLCACAGRPRFAVVTVDWRGGASNHRLHGQGRCGQDLGRGRDGPAMRARRPADVGPLDRPRALALGGPRGRAERGAHPGVRPPVGTGGPGAGGDGAQLVGHAGLVGRAAGGPGRRPDQRRGADGPARRGRAVLAARAQAPSRERRVRRDRRRLRTHRRDAAVAFVPGRCPLVAREGLSLRAPDHGRRAPDRAQRARPAAARLGRHGRRAAARRQPDRHERDPP